jgi:tetratricopeptide (TPR) repeat protein
MNPVRLLFLSAAAVVFLVAPQGAFPQDPQDNDPHIQPRKEEKQKRPAAKPSPSPQTEQPQSQAEDAGPGSEPEQASDLERGESSSKDSQIDLNLGPRGPGPAVVDNEPRWDPHRASKDIEVGNYYLRQKNYRAALERFHDALLYKPNDAEATYGLAVTQEKMDLFGQAYKSYNKYLEILPHGPMAKESEEGMKRMEQHLPPDSVESSEARQVQQDLAEGEKYLANNQYDAARQSFEHAMRLNPENPIIAFRMAQSLQGLERPDDARMYYRKYLELQPNGQFAADAKKNIAKLDDLIGK